MDQRHQPPGQSQVHVAILELGEPPLMNEVPSTFGLNASTIVLVGISGDRRTNPRYSPWSVPAASWLGRV